MVTARGLVLQGFRRGPATCAADGKRRADGTFVPWPARKPTQPCL